MPVPGDDLDLEAQRELSFRLLKTELLESAEFDVGTLGWEIGRYEIIRPLGAGATSEVHLAQDPLIGRRVAIKILHANLGVGEKRFTREMNILAALKHPNIVEIHDAGLHDGRPFFVMEYVGDSPLADMDLSLRESVAALRTVALACHAAHQQGVVHRDLKPANILRGEDGRWVVADFGISKLFEETHGGTTKVGQTIGTPAYMAPEQVGGSGPIGPRTDVYALGTMLYEALTGEVPFAQGSIMELLVQIASNPPTPPSELDPSVDPALERIALRALEKEPQERQPDARVLAAELQDWLDGGSAPASPAGRGVVVAAVVAILVACSCLMLCAIIRPRKEDVPPTDPPPPSGQLPLDPAPTPAPDAPPPVASAPGAGAWLERIARWEAAPAPSAGPLPVAELEDAEEALSALVAEASGAEKQRALLGRSRARAHLGRMQAATDDARNAGRTPGPAAGACRLQEARLLNLRLTYSYYEGAAKGGRGQWILRIMELGRGAQLSDVEAHEVAAIRALATGKLDAARDHLEELGEAGADRQQLALLRSQLLLLRGKSAQALAALSSAGDLRRTAISALSHRQLSHAADGNDATRSIKERIASTFASQRLAVEVLELRPAHEHSQRLLSTTWRSLGYASLTPSSFVKALPASQQNFARARAILQAEWERSPSPGTRLALGDAVLLEWGRVNREPTQLRLARGHLEAAVREHPTFEGWLSLMLMHLLTTQTDAGSASAAVREAARCLEEAEALAPGHTLLQSSRLVLRRVQERQ